MNRSIARIVLALVAVVLAAEALSPLRGGSLPQRMATHWGGDNRANGWSSATGLLLLSISVAVVCVAVLVTAMLARTPRVRGFWPTLTGLAGFVGGAIGGSTALTVHLARNSPDPLTTPGPTPLQLVAVIGSAMLFGAVAALAGRTAPARDPLSTVLRSPELGAGPQDVLMWHRSMSTRLFVLVGLAVVAVGVVLAVLGEGAVAIVMAALGGLIIAGLSRIGVSADQRGLTVSYGWWAWPRTVIPVRDMASVDAIDIDPGQWGGWGYRGSLRLFDRAAVVLRSGEGLRVKLRNGSTFAVTVDDAATGAAVLQRELADGSANANTSA